MIAFRAAVQHRSVQGRLATRSGLKALPNVVFLRREAADLANLVGVSKCSGGPALSGCGDASRGDHRGVVATVRVRWAGVEGVGAPAGEYQKERTRSSTGSRARRRLPKGGKVRREPVGQMLGEVGRTPFSPDATKAAMRVKSPTVTRRPVISSMMPAHHSGPRTGRRRWAHRNRPGEQKSPRPVKGEEYAEHDTEETQYRRRMRIESGIQVFASCADHTTRPPLDLR